MSGVDDEDVDDADYNDDDQADDDVDDLLVHSRTLNHSRLGLLRTSNNRLGQNLARAITVTKVKISLLLLFFNLLLGPPHHQHLDPVEPREFPRPRPLAAPLVAEQGGANKNSEEENTAEHGAGFICTKYEQ